MATAADRHGDVLQETISARTARVGAVGLGYAGLPLALEFAKAGFSVTGIDLVDSKVERINAENSYVQDVPSAEVPRLVESRRLRATTDFSVIGDSDIANSRDLTPLWQLAPAFRGSGIPPQVRPMSKALDISPPGRNLPD